MFPPPSSENYLLPEVLSATLGLTLYEDVSQECVPKENGLDITAPEDSLVKRLSVTSKRADTGDMTKSSSVRTSSLARGMGQSLRGP